MRVSNRTSVSPVGARAIMSLLTACAVLSASIGCAGRSLSRGEPDKHLTIGVVPYLEEPEFTTLVTGPRDPGEDDGSAGAGMVKGALLAPLYAGPIGILLAPFVVIIGGVGGAIANASFGPGRSDPFADAIDTWRYVNMTFQELVSKQIVAAGAAKTGHVISLYPGVKPLAWGQVYSAANIPEPPEKPLHAELRGKVDLVLELRVIRIGMIYEQEAATMTMFFDTRSRVVTPGSWGVVSEATHRYLVPGDPFRWSDNALEEKLATAARVLGDVIVESVFLGSERFPQKRTWDDRHCILRPLEPAAPEGPGNVRAGFAVPESASLSPTLVWEAFPRHREGITEKEGQQQNIRSVTYDLRVWKQREDGSPGELVYERKELEATPGLKKLELTQKYVEADGQEHETRKTISGIKTAEHTVTGVLDTGSGYLWSVRARYHGTDGEGITAWSRYLMKEYPGDSCEPDIVAPYAFYRFKTPGGASQGEK